MNVDLTLVSGGVFTLGLCFSKYCSTEMLFVFLDGWGYKYWYVGYVNEEEVIGVRGIF